ncbi:type II secretion system protein, partial [Anaerorhabdus sp.]
VVIAILAVLGLLLVPQISGYIDASKKAVGEANAKSCYSQLTLAKANKEAGLNMQVSIDQKCVPTDFTTFDGVKASWSDGGKTYTYEGGKVNTTTNP